MSGKTRAITFIALAWAWLPGSLYAYPKNHPPAKACPQVFNADSLRLLAQDCAGDLAHDANCRAYAKDENDAYVITRDCSPKKSEAYLLIPVQPVTGIDDARIFSPPLQNLWEDAWLWSAKYPGQPAARIGLAINSRNGRSQNQLHIHISCVLPEVSKALDGAHVSFYPAKAIVLELGPAKNPYKAVKVTTLAGDGNPFRVIQSMPGMADDMKDQSIAVVGSRRENEYYVLNTTSGGANRGHAEELLDQTCAAE